MMIFSFCVGASGKNLKTIVVFPRISGGATAGAAQGVSPPHTARGCGHMCESGETPRCT
jgi:hypothetical protein